MSRALLLDILRTVKKSKSRFISIIIIVALGAGFFVGIKSAGPSMSATATEYFKSNNLMDIRVQSPIGLVDTDVDAIKSVEGVSGVMAEKFVDALVLVNGEPEIDIDGSRISTRAYGINLKQLQEYYYGIDNPDFINRPTLLEGMYPTKSNQCLVDASALSTPESYKIGSVISLEADSNSDLSGLTVTEFEIVGIIESPYYLSFERGNSLVGSGKIGTYIFIPDSVITSEYYSEIYVTIDGSKDMDPYSDEYSEYIERAEKVIEKISEKCIETRVEELRENLPSEIKESQLEFYSRKTEVEKALENGKKQIETYQKYVDDPEGSYNEAVSKAAEALGIAENEFNGSQAEYYSAIETYNKNLEAYKAARAQQQEQYAKLEEAENQYNTAQAALNTAQTSVNSAKQLISSTESVISSANSILTSLESFQNGQMDESQLSQVLSTLQGINPELFESISSLSAVSMATEAIGLINPYLEQQKGQLATYEAQLATSQAQLDEYSEKFQQAAIVLNAAKTAYTQADAELDSAYDQLNEFYNQLEGTKSQLSSAQIELMLNQNAVSSDLDSLKMIITNAPEYLEKAKDEYNSAKKRADVELAQAEKQINKAIDTYNNLDSVKWNIYDRNSTPGYSSFESSVNNVNSLANIFPVIFFLVAALVSLTTMSRMIEEERTQMGTMKALGYSNGTIMSKYIVYALFASVIGSSVGILSGIYALPFAINKAYSIMFTLPELQYSFPVTYILAGILISILTTLTATVVAALTELNVNPASLMRPKAPKPGKRVLIEYVGFVWKRISFTGKVTIRNLFRRKARFIMTVIGIGGCTALILASSGLFTSVNSLMAKQYDAGGIANYDVQIVFADSQTPDSEIMKTLENDSRITSIMLSSMISVTGGSDNSEKTEDIYMFVPKDSAKLSSYISLQNRSNGNSFSLDNTGAIVTEKFAEDTNVQIGDRIWIETADGEKVYIPIANITENYTFNYVYLSEDLYQYLFQEKAEYNYALATTEKSILDETRTQDGSSKKASFAAEIMNYSEINAVAFVSDTVDTLNEVIGVLSVIIAIFFFAAGLLAFIVLYNLTNINISERQRELATIKVLGFHDKELSAYIYRENIFLTIMGIIFGLVAGIFVHKALLMYCSVDTVMFVQELSWISYLVASVMTLVFAVVVNMIMHKKIQSISMVDSLKAIE